MPVALLARSPRRFRGTDDRAAALARLSRVLAGLRDRWPGPRPGATSESPPVSRPGRPAASPEVAGAGRQHAEARSSRFAVEPTAAVGVMLVAVLAAAVGAVYLWRSQPTPVAPPRPVPVATTTASPSPSPSQVVVDVAGKVRDPGVFTLPEGSRVVDALEAAGGARRGADTTTLNLARVLTDGEQVLVGVPASTAPAVPSAAGGMPQVDLNTATPEQLEELPGVGPVLAQRIIDHRTSIGGFSTVDELQEVSGIGEQRMADLRDLVRV